MAVQTVRGPIHPEQLGVTLMHEHTFFESYPAWGGYDAVVRDTDLLVEELSYLTQAGGQALVDVTNIGLGRNPGGLRTLSERTGLQIVMGCGWYRERVYPDYIVRTSVNGLADMLIQEFEEGVDGTGVKPGIIGEIGSEVQYITPAEERVFRAAARAQRATGLPLMTHTTLLGSLALEQISLLREEGVAPERIIISHLGERRDIDDLLAVAETGVYFGIDHVGRNPASGLQPERQRARNVAAIVRAGYLHRTLISMDICGLSLLHWHGGHGYDYLLRTFVPLLREEGLGEGEIRTLLVENPTRVLDMTPPER